MDFLSSFLSRFGGGIGIIDFEIISLSISSAFWLVFLLFSINIGNKREIKNSNDIYLIIASTIGLIKEIILLILFIYLDYNNQNVIILSILENGRSLFPPLIHYLSLISIIFITFYFTLYFKYINESIAAKYIKYFIYSVTLFFILSLLFYSLSYSINFIWFNSISHIILVSILICLIILIYKKDKNEFIKNNILIFLFMLLISESLSLIDILSGYSNSIIISPFRNNISNFTTPVLIYILIKIQSNYLEEQRNEYIIRSNDRQVIIQGVSHELRSPLAGLIGIIDAYQQKFSYVIKDEFPKCDTCIIRDTCDHINPCASCKKVIFLNELVKNGFNTIEEIVKRLNEMVINLTMFGKNTNRYDIKCYNLIPLLETAVRYAKFTEKSKLVTTNGIKLGIGKNSIAYSFISPSKFLQIIQNVIMNSIKALQAKSDKSRPYIGISLITDENLGFHIITIEDNGIGMNEEQVKHCTEKYYTTDLGGSGLGLYFVSKYMEEFCGKLSISSTKGKGTIVLLYFSIVDQGDRFLCE